MNSVVSGSRLRQRAGEVGGVEVGDEVHAHAFQRVMIERARTTIAGPRSEPPMPMFTTSRIGLPVWPRQLPLWIDSTKRCMRLSTFATSRSTSTPSTTSGGRTGARRAVCSTARFSVKLMRSPLNMALRMRFQFGLARQLHQLAAWCPP